MLMLIYQYSNVCTKCCLRVARYGLSIHWMDTHLVPGTWGIQASLGLDHMPFMLPRDWPAVGVIAAVLPAKFGGLGRASQIARFMGPTWGPPGEDRTQVSPMNLVIRLVSPSLQGQDFIGFCGASHWGLVTRGPVTDSLNILHVLLLCFGLCNVVW